MSMITTGHLDGALRRRLDRRVVLKASAAFGAMAVAGGSGSLARRARAQSAGETLAGTYVPPASDGITIAAAAEGPIAFQADFPFYAVAPQWSAEVPAGSSVQMSLSADGESWSDPIAVYEAFEDAGQPERTDRRYGRLLATEGASFVSYQGLDPDGNAIPMPGLAFTYIDATAGPTLDEVMAPALEPTIAPPPIISRSDWGANEAYRYDKTGAELWTPEYQTVEHVIIHHTDTANFQDPLVAIRSIYYYHAVTRGWGDIGYNYLVDFMGNVYEGRVGGENVVGGHAYQYARGSSGIGTMGRFSVDSETPETLAGLVWITAWTGRAIDPLGAMTFHERPNLPTICGHRDVNDSTCPGDALYADLTTIRQYVSETLAAGVDPAPDPGDYAVGDTVVTVVTGGNLRETPDLGGRVLVQMALGEMLTVVDGPTTNDGYTWYELKGATRIGWAATVLFAPSTSTPPPPPTAGFAIGATVQVATDSLNLRTAARLDASVVAAMPNGTQGTVAAGPQSAAGYTWYQLTTGFGGGWSAGEFLLPSDGTTPPPTPSTTPPPATGAFAIGDAVTVATDSLNLRAGAGTSQAVLTRLPSGAPLTITQAPVSANGYVWYGVTSAQFGAGWCAADFLAASTDGGGDGGGIATGGTVQVVGGSLNLRAAAGTSATVLAVLPDGARLAVLDGPTPANGYTWWQVSSATFGTGWCAAAFLQEA